MSRCLLEPLGCGAGRQLLLCALQASYPFSLLSPSILPSSFILYVSLEHMKQRCCFVLNPNADASAMASDAPALGPCYLPPVCMHQFHCRCLKTVMLTTALLSCCTLPRTVMEQSWNSHGTVLYNQTLSFKDRHDLCAAYALLMHCFATQRQTCVSLLSETSTAAPNHCL